MLEHHELRKQLQQRNQELATALYEHDAAVRVIARLARERDQARQVIWELGIPPVWLLLPPGRSLDVCWTAGMITSVHHSL